MWPPLDSEERRWSPGSGGSPSDVRCLTPSIDRGFTASGATWSSGNAGNRGRNLACQAGRPVRVDGTGPEEVTADGSDVSRSSCLVGDERTSFIARPRFLLRARRCGRSSRIEHGVVGGCMHCRGFGSYDPQNTAGQRAAALRRCMAEASGVVRRSRVNLQSATYVPPAHERVPFAMADLGYFVRDCAGQPVVTAAIAYAQFCAISPYADGNGRAGRAFVSNLMTRWG